MAASSIGLENDRAMVDRLLEGMGGSDTELGQWTNLVFHGLKEGNEGIVEADEPEPEEVQSKKRSSIPSTMPVEWSEDEDRRVNI